MCFKIGLPISRMIKLLNKHIGFFFSYIQLEQTLVMQSYVLYNHRYILKYKKVLEIEYY